MGEDVRHQKKERDHQVRFADTLNTEQNSRVKKTVVYVEKLIHINLIFIKFQNVLEPKRKKHTLPLLPRHGLATCPT